MKPLSAFELHLFAEWASGMESNIVEFQATARDKDSQTRHKAVRKLVRRIYSQDVKKIRIAVDVRKSVITLTTTKFKDELLSYDLLEDGEPAMATAHVSHKGEMKSKLLFKARL